MIPFDLTLHYTLAPGWLAPWAKALQEGRALGCACTGCGNVSFPPTRICNCGSADHHWIEMSGEADVTLRTTGRDGDFGLAAFAGATGLAVVRLDGFAPDDRRGRIAPSPGNRPALLLRPVHR